MNFIKCHWKLLLIVIIVIVVLFWIGSLTGTNNKLYKMVLDQLSKGESQIVKDKDAWIKTCESEILRIKEEKDKISREKVIAREEAAKSRAEVSRLKGENDALQNLIDHLVVSNNPDQLISDLQRRGIKIRRRNMDTR